MADLLDTMGKRSHAAKMRREVFTELQKRLKQRPALLNDPLFLTHYLRVAVYYLPADAYRKVLTHAQKVLDRQAYLNFKVAWAVYRGSGDYAQFLARQLKKPALWMRTYLTARSHDTTRMRELLYRYGAIIPAVEKVNFQISTGEIAAARETLFKAQEKNPESEVLYRQKVSLEKQYANRLVTDMGYDRQGDFENGYVRMKNLQHLSNALYLGTLFAYGRNTLSGVPGGYNSEETMARLWLKLMTEKSEVAFGGGYRNSYSQSGQLFLSMARQFTAKLHAKADLQKNGVADETIDLRRRGEKDQIRLQAQYTFDPRYSISVDAAHSIYRDQDGSKLGTGERYGLEADQRLQFDYPDLVVREYLHAAHFSPRGIRNRLPKSYTEGGIGLSIGKSVTDRYNASWKPYADLSATYHNRFGFYFGGGVGLCGRLFTNDYLNLYLGYSRSAAEDEPLWNFKLTHNYLY